MKLSPGEQRALAILPPNGGRVSTAKVAARYYKALHPTTNQRIVVTGLLRSLERKTARATVRVKRSHRAGPHPIEVWIERKK
jgi:hypothetical protein